MSRESEQEEEDLIGCYRCANGLTDFLEKVPHFRAGFDASNQSGEKLMHYIQEHIDPELDLMKIGMKGSDGHVDWYHIYERFSLQQSLMIYAAEKGVSSTKSLVFKHNGSTLFSSKLKRNPNQFWV